MIFKMIRWYRQVIRMVIVKSAGMIRAILVQGGRYKDNGMSLFFDGIKMAALKERPELAVIVIRSPLPAGLAVI